MIPDMWKRKGVRYQGVARRNILSSLADEGACSPGRLWVEEQGDVSPVQLWSFCPRGDWMLWYLREVAPRPRTEAEIPAYLELRSFVVRTCLPKNGDFEGALAMTQNYEYNRDALGRATMYFLASWVFQRAEYNVPILSDTKQRRLAAGIRRRFKLEWSQESRRYMPVPVPVETAP